MAKVEERRDLLLAALLCGLVLLVGYRGLTLGGGLFVGGDVAQMHVPVRDFVQGEVAAGRGLPLWFGGDGLGVPLIGAAVPALLHPPSYLGWPLGAARAFWLASLLMVVLAFFGTRALARELGASEVGALLAAAAYVLGGPYVSNLQNYQFFAGLSCLPLLLFGLLRFPRARAAGPALAATAATFLMLTAGSFQAAYLGWGLGLLLVLLRAGPREGLRSLPALGLLLSLSLAAGAIQLLPSLETFRHAGRLGGLPWEMASRWSLHPRTLVDLALGDLLRFEPAHQPGLAPLYDLSERTPWIAVAYTGVLVLALAGLGLAGSAQPRRLRIGLGVTLLLLILAALGKHTPLYGWLHAYLPLWGGFRYPAKLLPYAALLLALLAAFGLDGLRPALDRRRAIPLAGAVLLLLVLGLQLTGGSLLDPATEADAATRWWARFGPALLRAGAVLAVAGGLLHLAWRRQRERLGAHALLALACLELSAVTHHAVWLYAGSAPPLERGAGFAGALLAEHAARGAPEGQGPRVFTLLAQAKGLPVKGHPLNTLTLSTFERLALKPDFAALSGLEAAAPYLPGTDARINDLLLSVPPAEAARRAAFFGVRFLVTDPPTLEALGLGRERVRSYSRKAGLLLVELPEEWVRPRVYLARPATVAGDLTELATLREALDLFEVSRGAVALLEEEHSPRVQHDAGAPEGLRVERWWPGHLEIALEGGAPGGAGRILVLNEGWAPGWRARVDGAETPVLRVDGMLRGVAVEGGAKKVELRYQPPGLLGGGLLSLLTWLLLLAWAGWSRWRGRDLRSGAAPALE
ncbi:MAG: hypothetical protein P1V51_17875 [Deltaproteobacteria bacterium]|nr:hypothetical protein [Deltaproteobacteria bacterium]